MAPFSTKTTKPSRSASAPSTPIPLKGRFSLDTRDPLTLVLSPAQDESADERATRIAREMDERAVSDRIDAMLKEEQREKQKRNKQVNELEILLLGPTGAGKTTFLKQLRLAYDQHGLDSEREACRLVILLNILQSVRTLLALLEDDAASPSPTATLPSPDSSAPNPFRPLSPTGRADTTLTAPRNAQEAAYRRRIRLAPLLGLESQLRDSLGCIASTGSMAAHANGNSNEGVQKLGWRDTTPLSEVNNLSYENMSMRSRESSGKSENGSSLRSEQRAGSAPSSPGRRHRARPTSGEGLEREPIFAPGFAGKIGLANIAFGSGKEGRRARAQGGANGAGGAAGKSGMNPDGSYTASPDDPIHLLAALREEVEGVWEEAVGRGLIAGEGERENERGGFDLSESARYFLGELGRIASKNWYPSDDDILNVRVRTLGIETHELQISLTQVYKICDVAGARGIKHSWAPYFDTAAAIIFISNVADYTVCDPRDPTANRFADALDLFEDIAKSKILINVTMIVFLNKVDVLRKKLKSGLYPVEQYLPRYKGGSKPMEVLQFMQSEFESRHDTDARQRPIYTYATQANDQKSIRFVLSAVGDILMRSTLSASGLM
ncbi:hypothetical protein MNV49_005098 [Pseudohyphozyma bogoriensis]|nr:hypothetical protein MNV49_005098 [Pseudohyphozyma bogoriensis]